MQASYDSETEGQLKFNLAIAIEALNKTCGEDVVNRVLAQENEESDEIRRRKVLAVSGWNCRKV